MDTIYLDNASTTFPKPKEVAEAMTSYMLGNGCNINRGCYESAYQTEELVYETRELINEMLQGPDPSNVIFTKNITESLNIILKGFLKPGDHVIVSSMEHNAIMRPIIQLEKQGITYTRIPCDSYGRLSLTALQEAFTDKTTLVAMLHGSNVCGTLLPLQEIGQLCHQKNVKFLVDTAQTAGIVPISMKDMHIDCVCFTGHKGLLGPQGIGGFVITEEFAQTIEPLLSGGTGSISHMEEIPEFLPDKFEPGTMNLPGILGLRAALLWIKSHTTDQIFAHELALTEAFLKKLLAQKELRENLRLVGLPYCYDPATLSPVRTGVISIQPLTMDPAMLAYELDSQYHIQTRVGLHCAPSAHKTLQTYPAGTVRFSFGIHNTIEDVEKAYSALTQLLL